MLVAANITWSCYPQAEMNCGVKRLTSRFCNSTPTDLFLFPKTLYSLFYIMLIFFTHGYKPTIRNAALNDAELDDITCTLKKKLFSVCAQLS